MATAKRQANLRLSYQDGKGYLKTIGKTVDGKPRRFWLGKEESQAQRASLALQQLWQSLGGYWTAEALAVAETIRLGAALQNPPQALAPALGQNPLAYSPAALVGNPGAPESQGNGKALTLHKAFDAYLEQYQESACLSQTSKHSQRCRHTPLLSTFPNKPIAALTLQDITTFVHYWAARPQGIKGRRMSAMTSIGILRYARAAFQWIDDNDIAVLPRKWDRVFRLKKYAATLRQQEQDISFFSLDELTLLYDKAKPWQRLLMLLGLNCGFAQAEIASLCVGEIHLDAPAPYIDRQRAKTGVRGKWLLWTETADLLRQFANGGSADDLALTTESDKPLLYFTDSKSGKVDNISNVWTSLVRRCNVKLSFKYLRKTSANWIRQHGGIEVSEAHLAHSDRTLAKLYTNRNFDKVFDALTAYRVYLAPLFKA